MWRILDFLLYNDTGILKPHLFSLRWIYCLLNIGQCSILHVILTTDFCKLGLLSMLMHVVLLKFVPTLLSSLKVMLNFLWIQNFLNPFISKTIWLQLCFLGTYIVK